VFGHWYRQRGGDYHGKAVKEVWPTDAAK